MEKVYEEEREMVVWMVRYRSWGLRWDVRKRCWKCSFISSRFHLL